MKIEEIQDIFFQECDEGLIQAECGLLALQSGSHNGETINTIFRAVHSIKGGSGAFGFKALQHFTHHFESLLDQVRNGERAICPALVETLLSAFDTLADHVAAIRGEKPTPDDLAMLERLQRASANAPAAETAAGATSSPVDDDPLADMSLDLSAMINALNNDTIASIAAGDDNHAAPLTLSVRPLNGAITNGSEPLFLIRELIDLGGTLCVADWSNVPDIDAFDPHSCYLAWQFELPSTVERSQVEEIFEFVQDDCVLTFGTDGISTDPQTFPPSALVPPPVPADEPGLAIPCAEPGSPRSPMAAVPAPEPVASAIEPVVRDDEKAPNATAVGVTPTIRVDLEKLDRLVNLVGELVITQSMLAQRLLNCGLAQISELVDIDHLTRELQDSAMSIRAQPIQSVFGRVPRIVRELQQSTGKQIRLDLEGESTELDKTVIERIGEPLTHLIRNAIDHGIETPEERVAAGKSREGRIRLSAEHRSGRILICVSDDGRGINRERVFAKAVERGLIAADAKMSDEEIDNLIFAAGFSTAECVSNISGRGVGMDVVRRNVQALGGRITITSTPGEGSTFTLALPLTLAILDGMIVSVGEHSFVIPLSHIVESLRPLPEAVRPMGANQLMMNVRGTWLPILRVADELAISGAKTDPAEAVLIVVESQGAGQGILMVDGIVDQRQVVIKSLEANYGPVSDVAGATILGDGRVALILDVEAITTAHRSSGPDRRPQIAAGGRA